MFPRTSTTRFSAGSAASSVSQPPGVERRTRASSGLFSYVRLTRSPPGSRTTVKRSPTRRRRKSSAGARRFTTCGMIRGSSPARARFSAKPTPARITPRRVRTAVGGAEVGAAGESAAGCALPPPSVGRFGRDRRAAASRATQALESATLRPHRQRRAMGPSQGLESDKSDIVREMYESRDLSVNDINHFCQVCPPARGGNIGGAAACSTRSGWDPRLTGRRATGRSRTRPASRARPAPCPAGPGAPRSRRRSRCRRCRCRRCPESGRVPRHR